MSVWSFFSFVVLCWTNVYGLRLIARYRKLADEQNQLVSRQNDLIEKQGKLTDEVLELAAKNVVELNRLRRLTRQGPFHG